MKNWKFKNITTQFDPTFWCIGVHWTETEQYMNIFSIDFVIYITLIPCISIKINFKVKEN